MKCGAYLKSLMADGISLFRASKGRLKRGMNCFSGIEIGVFGGTDGLGVDWLSDDDCLKSIEGNS